MEVANKSPQQAFYDWLYQQITAMGYDVYDHLPMQTENAKYPFVVLEQSGLVSSHTKTSLTGTINQTLDVWGDSSGRLTVSTIANQLLMSVNKSFIAFGYKLDGRHWQSTSDLSTDQSVPNSLFYRAMVTLTVDIR